jgi:hypothetical protein
MFNKKKIYFLLILNLIIFSNCICLYAASDNNWGVNIKDWVLKQTSAIAIAVVVIIIIPLIYKREWSALIGTIFASGIALFFINKPETLNNIGKTLYNIIFNSTTTG